MPELLGPDGRPASLMFKKDKAPPTGPSYGVWGSDDMKYTKLPGGGILGFDLSQLRLEDFENMRMHPTLNSALSVLTFMIHQVDYEIRCKDKRIQDAIEENFRDIWTRLVRGLSQAFWAGYSPNVLEYENDPVSGLVKINKIKDLRPETCKVAWKNVTGGFAPPGMKPPKFKVYDGISQYGAPFNIPAVNTLWYPILMENGDMYGRKLLKPAFMPWYFSILIHLFSNRYFERFGEPTIFGRAPFDEDFPQKDGTVKTGKEIMEQILIDFRNRGVITLPSERDPAVTSAGANKAYTWEIDYLESQMRGADFERYLSRLDEEMSLALFTPLLLLRNADVGSHNLGVQHVQCVNPDTKILCADLVWRKAGSLKSGQEIVAFDENADHGQGRGVNARCYRTAKIVGNRKAMKMSMRVSTDIGDPVVASVDHPWLVWRNRTGAFRTKGLVWVETKDLQIGDQIAFLTRPWEREESNEAGWLSGIIDGEGSLVRHKGTQNGTEFIIAQNDGPVFQKLKQALTDRGISFSISNHHSESNLGSGQCQRIRINGGMRGAMELVGKVGSVRFGERGDLMWEGYGVRRNQTCELATVTDLENVGMSAVASIRTSTGTFITEGYLTHNTYLWMLNALTGDMREYIERFVLNRLKSINFSPNAPKVEWVPKKMGKESVETLRAVITELIRQGMANVDLDELGVALGMTVHEIRQATAPPGTDPNNPVPPTDNPSQRTGRDRSTSGPRGVGEPRATGRQISNRIRGQVEKAFHDGRFGTEFNPSMGFRRRFEQSLLSEGWASDEAVSITNEFYDRIERFMATATALGSNEFNGANDFMSLVDRQIDTEVERLASR